MNCIQKDRDENNLALKSAEFQEAIGRIMAKFSNTKRQITRPWVSFVAVKLNETGDQVPFIKYAAKCFYTMGHWRNQKGNVNEVKL